MYVIIDLYKVKKRYFLNPSLYVTLEKEFTCVLYHLQGTETQNSSNTWTNLGVNVPLSKHLTKEANCPNSQG